VAWIASQLARIHALVTASPATVICAGSGADAQALAELVAMPAQGAGSAATATGALAGVPADCALHVPSQVNHCHLAWPVPDERHPDAPALAVAAELLTHQFLHTAIREKGGAYGGGASYVPGAGIFAMKSFRDPRLAGTYADFASALDGLEAAVFPDEQVEQAIISVIKGLDRPASPFDAVLLSLNLQRRGIGAADRARFRTGVLNCTADAVKAAADRWLRTRTPNRAAFAGDKAQDLAGLMLVDLLALTVPDQLAA